MTSPLTEEELEAKIWEVLGDHLDGRFDGDDVKAVARDLLPLIQQSQPQGWRDMASAPRDGTRIILRGLYRKSGRLPESEVSVRESFWAVGVWQTKDGTVAGSTGWLPLPDAQAPASKEAMEWAKSECDRLRAEGDPDFTDQAPAVVTDETVGNRSCSIARDCTDD
jgi:hypothetical protein